MFGALNRFISRLDADSPAHTSSNHGGFGFQVLRNKDVDLPIEPWFDFIVGINGRHIDNSDPNLFAQEVRNCAGSSVTLGLWSAKGQRVRELRLPVPLDPPSLGLSLQWTAIGTTEDVWHILDVAPDSPAEQAGLLPYGDYIIGTPEGIVRGEAGLGELVEDVRAETQYPTFDIDSLLTNRQQHLSRPLDLYVYNHEYNLTRPVTITPSKHWGGSGSLGCVLGYGALHRLPAPLQEPPQGPGETLFEAVRFSHEDDRHPSRVNPGPARMSISSADLLVPAEQLAGSAPPPMGGGGGGVGGGGNANAARTASPASTHHRPGRKARAVHGYSPNRAMDEYFKEGEAKSREADHAPSPGPGAGVPPPPKSGIAAPPPGKSPSPTGTSQ
ncbi:MAG: protein disulfide-isomerase precursor [Watsoniomyces obsoletus]|nr:MAG: protein disulfide-isomerase precursor [Watsoniomyces obsoletus]